MINEITKEEIELSVKIISELLAAIKSECEGNCNSCLLKKECCLFAGVPSQWDIKLLEERIRQVIEIESRIKERDQKNE